MIHDQYVRFSTTDAGEGTHRWMVGSGSLVEIHADNAYEAPELLQDEGVRSKETDVYALGMVNQYCCSMWVL